jgi:hypothetical protein
MTPPSPQTDVGEDLQKVAASQMPPQPSPPLALVAGFGGGVQQFAHRTAGMAVAGGVGFTAEPAPQFQLDLGSMALGNPVEELVLVAWRQILDPSA